MAGGCEGVPYSKEHCAISTVHRGSSSTFNAITATVALPACFVIVS